MSERLFTAPDGSPLAFSMTTTVATVEKQSSRAHIKGLVETHGGKWSAWGEPGVVKLVFPDEREQVMSAARVDKQVYHSADFVYDCVRAGELLDMGGYAIHAPEPPPRKKRQYHAFTDGDDAALLRYVREAPPSRGSVTGKRFWQLAKESLPEQQHTWQSMKDRFLKHIKPAQDAKRSKPEPTRRAEGGGGGPSHAHPPPGDAAKASRGPEAPGKRPVAEEQGPVAVDPATTPGAQAHAEAGDRAAAPPASPHTGGRAGGAGESSAGREVGLGLNWGLPPGVPLRSPISLASMASLDVANGSPVQVRVQVEGRLDVQLSPPRGAAGEGGGGGRYSYTTVTLSDPRVTLTLSPDCGADATPGGAASTTLPLQGVQLTSRFMSPVAAAEREGSRPEGSVPPGALQLKAGPAEVAAHADVAAQAASLRTSPLAGSAEAPGTDPAARGEASMDTPARHVAAPQPSRGNRAGGGAPPEQEPGGPPPSDVAARRDATATGTHSGGAGAGGEGVHMADDMSKDREGGGAGTGEGLVAGGEEAREAEEVGPGQDGLNSVHRGLRDQQAVPAGGAPAHVRESEELSARVRQLQQWVSRLEQQTGATEAQVLEACTRFSGDLNCAAEYLHTHSTDLRTASEAEWTVGEDEVLLHFWQDHPDAQPVEAPNALKCRHDTHSIAARVAFYFQRVHA